MAFFLGMLCGVVMAVAVRCVWMECMPMSGVEKPSASHSPSHRTQWTQTHNFLYYDGTVMPEIKEDDNE